ncbi:hypothetical protein ANCCAN_10605 [Ancylostoma caninum]|uniref:L-Fucosyltransferase n=1 Tax=Ancylostoma caninum TaxID=29170 RepID=A0A368GG97_ANCCA|nr:hypothetical protein ANCCAN_10605 [Ancylostoma caninum]
MNIYNWQPYKKKTIPTKFVGFHLTYGRVGNQLFHLITGYGIARTLKRTHYLPYEDGMIQHVEKYLKSFKKVFPRLEQTYVIAQNRTDDEVIVPFAFGSCCVYDEPLRLINLTDKYLLLNFGYGQNPSYFEKYLPDVRNILQFSEEMQRNGSEVIDPLMMDYSNSLCIHIRRTDFIERNISTDMMTAVRAANSIARKKNISRFVIFGDDKDFMRDMSQEIVEEGHWKANAALVSEFDEYTDLYAASRMCKAFLITAVTSSFGWWLAFFIPDQNNVYYLPDTRNHADKIPSKELFL